MGINEEKIQRRINFLDKISWIFINSVEVLGEENLKNLERKIILIHSNHKSFWEIQEYTKLFSRNEIKQPYIIASKHLDTCPTNKFLNEETGMLFIDRSLAKGGSPEQKIEIKQKEISKIEKVVEEGNNLLYFPEGGFRNVGKKVMENTGFTYSKYFIQSIMKLDKNPDDYFVLNLAVNYKDKTIEEPFFEFSKKMKQKNEEFLKKIKNSKNKIEKDFLKAEQRIYFLSYYYSDPLAYLTQIVRKKPKVLINVGEPFSLKDYIRPGGWLDLGQDVEEDVKRLYKQIS